MTALESLGVTDIGTAVELLAESARYVDRNWDEAGKLLVDALPFVRRACPGETGDRLILNLTVAYDARVACPGVFKGYVAGVRHELVLVRDRLTKARG